MKTRLFFIGLFTVFCVSVYSQIDSGKVTIEIYSPPGEYDSLSYHCSFLPYSVNEGYKHIHFDSSGNANLELHINKINYLLILFNSNKVDYNSGFKNRVSLLIRPGENYKIEYNSGNQFLFDITGDYGYFQELYTEYKFRECFWVDNSDTVPERIKSNLNDSIKLALSPFNSLYKEYKIDSVLYKYIKTEIEYTYVYSMIHTIAGRNITPEIAKRLKNKKYAEEIKRMGIVYIDVGEEKWNNLISFLLNDYTYDNPYTTFVYINTNPFGYLNTYLWFRSLKDSLKLKNSFTSLSKKEKIKFAKANLNDSIYEYYFATQFGYSSLAVTDSMKVLYEEFKQEFPKSIYLKSVEERYKFFTVFFDGYYPDSKQTSKTFVEKQDDVLPKKSFIPDMFFIEGKDSITSLDSLLSKFKGKPVFVDVWASWCPPCRYEFQFADTLYDFLSKNGFDILYLSIDKSEEKWLSVAKHYALKGFHFRAANEKINAEIRKIAPFIPTYLIVNENGVIVNDDARKPHEKEELFNQLLDAKNSK